MVRRRGIANCVPSGPSATPAVCVAWAMPAMSVSGVTVRVIVRLTAPGGTSRVKRVPSAAVAVMVPPWATSTVPWPWADACGENDRLPMVVADGACAAEAGAEGLAMVAELQAVSTRAALVRARPGRAVRGRAGRMEQVSDR